MPEADVVHAIDGRLRIRVAAIKHQPARTAALAARIRRIVGVNDVTTNTVAGSMVITYRSTEIDERTLFRQLAATMRCPIRAPAQPAAAPIGRELQRHITTVVLKSAMEAALRRALVAVI